MGNEIKNNIKLAAINLFVNNGYDSTSIRDLAKAANCSLPMLYYYYESKSNLLSEIISDCFIPFINEIYSTSTVYGNALETVLNIFDRIDKLDGLERAYTILAFKVLLGEVRGEEELRKKLIADKNSREFILKKILFKQWADDKNIEVKTRVLFKIMDQTINDMLLMSKKYNKNVVSAELKLLF